MQINRVFDFIGPSGFIPNGVNYKYTSDMWDSNFYIDNIFIDEFNKKYLLHLTGFYTFQVFLLKLKFHI